MVEQTSIKDKTHVFEAIETLEKGKLAKRLRIRTSKQKKILVIEQMGRDLVNFMNNIDRFRKSFHSLTKTIDENFNFEERYVMMREITRQLSEEEKTASALQPSEEYRSNEKSLRNKLLARNWTNNEIDSHYNWADQADKFHYSSAHAFIMGLFTKYLSISLRSGNTEISRAILTKTIMDSLNQHVADVNKYLQNLNAKFPDYNKDLDYAYIGLIFSLNPQISEYIEEFSEEETVRRNRMISPPTFEFVPKINNRFLKEDATEVMRSIGNMYEFDYKLDDNKFQID